MRVDPLVAVLLHWLKLERQGKARITVALHLGRITHRRRKP